MVPFQAQQAHYLNPILFSPPKRKSPQAIVTHFSRRKRGRQLFLLANIQAMRGCIKLYTICSSSLLSSHPKFITAFNSVPLSYQDNHRTSPFAVVNNHRHYTTFFRNLTRQLSESDNIELTPATEASKSKTKKMATKKSKKKDDVPTVPHAPDSLFPNTSIDKTRTKLLTLSTPFPCSKESLKNPSIIYWMIRDARTIDNWALLFAQSLAIQNAVPLRVVYTLPPPPNEDAQEGEDGSPPNPTELSLTERHGTFLLDGLKIVAEELTEAKVPFDVLCPPYREQVGETIHNYAITNDALAVICDMSPLRAPRTWTESQSVHLLQSSNIPLYQVDAHNIVPVWVASPKREVGARTLRPKIHNVFGGYCCSFPEFCGNAHIKEDVALGKDDHDWEGYKTYMKLDVRIKSVEGMRAGHESAMKRWKEFCSSTQEGL